MNLLELRALKVDQKIAILRAKGQSKEDWLRQLTRNGCPKEFKQTIQREYMNEFTDNIKEQITSMEMLFDKHAECTRKLKSNFEENNQYIRKSSGDIKDSVEKLRQSLDKFLQVIDNNKLTLIASNIEKITECLLKLDSLEKSGSLSKLKTLFDK